MILSLSNKNMPDENKREQPITNITETSNNTMKLNASLRHFSIQVPLYPDSHKS